MCPPCECDYPCKGIGLSNVHGTRPEQSMCSAVLNNTTDSRSIRATVSASWRFGYSRAVCPRSCDFTFWRFLRIRQLDWTLAGIAHPPLRAIDAGRCTVRSSSPKGRGGLWLPYWWRTVQRSPSESADCEPRRRRQPRVMRLLGRALMVRRGRGLHTSWRSSLCALTTMGSHDAEST